MVSPNEETLSQATEALTRDEPYRAPAVHTGANGRPPLDVLRTDAQWAQFDAMLAIQATQAEIAAAFGCSEGTLRARVQEEKGIGYEEYRKSIAPRGLVSLRRKQFEMALAGDRTMLIWLGKQHLGQADKVDQRHTGADGGPIEFKDASLAGQLVLEQLASIAARHQLAQTTLDEVHAHAAVTESHPLRAIAAAAGGQRDGIATPDDATAD